jgi:hypothetical protein
MSVEGPNVPCSVISTFTPIRTTRAGMHTGRVEAGQMRWVPSVAHRLPPRPAGPGAKRREWTPQASRWPCISRCPSGIRTRPTPLIVGGRDDVVLDLNRKAQQPLHCQNRLAIVPSAIHLFGEPGALQAVANRPRLVHHAPDIRCVVAGGAAAHRSRSMTCSSDVCGKSSYHSPTEEKSSGVCRQITSSASRRRLPIESGGPTRTASTMWAAL